MNLSLSIFLSAQRPAGLPRRAAPPAAAACWAGDRERESTQGGGEARERVQTRVEGERWGPSFDLARGRLPPGRSFCRAGARLLPVHEAQVLTYLKLTDLDIGLLVNFNTPVLRRGIRRLVRRGAEAIRLARFRIEDDHSGTTSRPASTQPETAGARAAGSND
ncbi:GxxExxY protein [Sorangium sp. So ce1128]